jgi:hypothetical protein
MKTVNSISGGKTSSFLEVHYPADYSLFSLITVSDKTLTPKDIGLVKIVSDKIGKEFIGTVESDKTLKVVLDLEQYTGRQIIWLTGEPFENIIKKAGGYLPNIMTRFCTSQMKMKPIAEFCRNEIKETVLMRLGIRADEEQRVNYENVDFKFHNGFSENGRNKWITEKYRELDYPLVNDKIYHYQIYQWSKTIGIDFPSDSNCVGCFHKDLQQLRKNWDDEPEKMQWFANQEQGKKRWKKEINYTKIKTIGLQSDFNFGTGSGCNGGFCTD